MAFLVLSEVDVSPPTTEMTIGIQENNPLEPSWLAARTPSSGHPVMVGDED